MFDSRAMGMIVVTGANRGIGLALVETFRARGLDVLAVCRSSSAQLEETGAEVLSGVDVTKDGDVQQLVQHIAQRSIDVLVNNAGILRWGDSLESPQFEDMRAQFEVNTLGPIRVTSALLDCFTPGSKVAMITSRMGSIADNGSGGAYGYRMSKAALNMAAVSMARDLKARGVAVALLHPGMVATEMIGVTNGQIQPAEAAKGLVKRIDALTLETSGSFWHQNGESLPW
ncbi:MAG: SDR family oxidoreductase [Polyangiaceae bacterium]|nr:SDR family oxidoreductase [Polyangiaceae bacterium]